METELAKPCAGRRRCFSPHNDHRTLRKMLKALEEVDDIERERGRVVAERE